MSSNIFIAFITALSGSTWLYARYYKTRTMDTKSSLMLAGVTFAVIFFIMMIVLSYLNSPSDI